jgi:hypothetical protein
MRVSTGMINVRKSNFLMTSHRCRVTRRLSRITTGEMLTLFSLLASCNSDVIIIIIMMALPRFKAKMHEKGELEQRVASVGIVANVVAKFIQQCVSPRFMIGLCPSCAVPVILTLDWLLSKEAACLRFSFALRAVFER